MTIYLSIYITAVLAYHIARILPVTLLYLDNMQIEIKVYNI